MKRNLSIFSIITLNYNVYSGDDEEYLIAVMLRYKKIFFLALTF